MKTLSIHTTLALLLAVTGVSTLPACQPGGSPTQTTSNGASAGPGFGTIKGVVTAEGIQASALRGVLQAQNAKSGKVKCSSGLDTKEVDLNADGSFSVVVKGGTDYNVEATVPDGKGGTLKTTAKVNVPLAQDPPIVDVKSLVTRRTGSIQGLIELKDAKPGETAEGTDIFISGGTSIVGKAGETGRFSLTGVPEGTWNVVIQKPGYKRLGIGGVRVRAGQAMVIAQPAVMEREAVGAAGIKGVIKDNNGAAIVGATVTAFPKDPAAVANAVGALESFSAVSNDQGEFQMLNLPAGDYQVQVYRPFYQLPPRQDVTVQAAGTSDLGTVTLTSTVVYFGQISAQAVDESGKPVDGAVAQLSPPVTDAQFADAAGNFTLDRVMPGEYTLSVSAGGHEIYTRELVVENRQGFKLTLDTPVVLRDFVSKDQLPAVGSTASPPRPEKEPAGQLFAPEVDVQDLAGNDVMLRWPHVRTTATVREIVYDIEMVDASGKGYPLGSMADNRCVIETDGNATEFRVRARGKDVPYDSGAGAYQLFWSWGNAWQRVSAWASSAWKWGWSNNLKSVSALTTVAPFGSLKSVSAYRIEPRR